VNAVFPCDTETEGFARNGRIGGAEAIRDLQTSLGQMGRPVDIANVVAFLASSDTAWITGQLIPVSRGFHLSKKTAITA